MAVDSAAKRASALYFIGRRKGRLIPDGTIAQPDFQNIVGFYMGIQAAAAAAAVSPIEFYLKGPQHKFHARGPKHKFFRKDSRYRFHRNS
jgi:hypothetical protein